MPRRKDSFSRALADAQKRLDKAQGEREKIQKRLIALNAEIPYLQSLIVALGQRPGISYKELEALYNKAMEGPIPNLLVTPPPHMTIEEQAKWYTERDLSGVSSIPPGGAKPAVPLPTEDELLPDDLPGKPVLEK